MRVLALSGSLRRDSYNTALLRAAAEVAPQGVEVERYEGLASLPPYDADSDVGAGPSAVQDLRERIAAADALLIATPEYNGSIPGLLKNAVDWASRPLPGSALGGKTVAVIGASTGQYGGMWAQTELRKSLGVAGARVLANGVAVPKAQERFDHEGTLLDVALRDQLAALLAALAAETEAFGVAA